MARVATQKISLSFSCSFVFFALSFAFSFVHSFALVSCSFSLVHSFTCFVSFAFHSFRSLQCSYIHMCLSLVGMISPTTRHSQVSTLDIAVYDLQCLSERVDIPDIHKRSLSKDLPVVFSCLFFKIMNSLKSLSEWSLRKRKPMISSVKTDCAVYATFRMFSPCPHCEQSLARPSVICANIYASCLENSES